MGQRSAELRAERAPDRRVVVEALERPETGQVIRDEPRRPGVVSEQQVHPGVGRDRNELAAGSQVAQGRGAIFADCGLGKTPMQLEWADRVSRHMDKPVLIARPLAVSYQVVREGEKFGIECHRAIDGNVPPVTF